MYIERLILGEVYGEAYRHFQAILGYGELVKTCEDLKDQPELTKLRPNLDGIDPDDAFSRIPYEKGFLMLFYLETLVGKEKMIEWLQSYFNKFIKQSLTSEDMKESFINHFKDYKTEKTQGKDWNAIFEHWFYCVGLPEFNPLPHLDQSLNSACDHLTIVWKDKNGEGASANDVKWDAHQTMVLLDNLLNTALPMKHDVLKKMDELYNLTNGNNVEVVFRWHMLCLQSNYIGLLPQLEVFLSKHGRGVYVKPLYKQLIKMGTENVIPFTKVVEIYKKNRSYYHSVIRNTFDAQLNK